MAADDLVDVVDPDGTITAVVTRAEMRARNLRHRAVYVVVRTTDDGIVVHKRADWKDVAPGWWDLCFGGVVDAGEGWHAAAVRELAEEAGIDSPVTEMGAGNYDAPGVGIVGRIFSTVHDGPYPCPDGEVVEHTVVPRAELAAWVDAHQVCEDSVELVLPLVLDA